MREACLYYNFCNNIFGNLRGINEMNTLDFFFWRWPGDESPRWGHSPRMSGGSGDENSLPNSFGREFISFIKTDFYGGALTSHFMEEHSSPTSIFPVFMMTSSNGIVFRVTSFCAGNSPVTAGNSPVTGEFPSHKPVTRSFDVFFDLRLNKRLSKQPRRRWFETPSRSLWRHCIVVPNYDPVIWAAVGSSAFNPSLLSNFELVKRVKLGGSVHYGRKGLKFGTLLYPDYHSLKLTIFFLLGGSLSLWGQIIHKLVLSWGWNKWNIRSL